MDPEQVPDIISTNPNLLLKLPKELLDLTLLKLPYKTVIEVCSKFKEFKHILDDEIFWYKKCRQVGATKWEFDELDIITREKYVYFEIVKELRDFSPEIRVHIDDYIIIEAAKRGCPSIVKYVAKNKEHGLEILFLTAVSHNYIDIINSINIEGGSPCIGIHTLEDGVFVAVRNGNYSIIDCLLEKWNKFLEENKDDLDGLDISSPNELKSKMFREAITYDQLGVVVHLAATINNIKDIGLEQAVNLASERGALDILKFLNDKTGWVKEKVDYLLLESMPYDLDVIDYLLSLGGDVDLALKSACNARYIINNKDIDKIIEVLMGKGANDFNTALYELMVTGINFGDQCMNNKKVTKVFEFLLSKGGKIESVDEINDVKRMSEKTTVNFSDEVKRYYVEKLGIDIK